ncbi:MAG: T9SS type B sorting domain-containing protein [Winogradskyella sp.]|nr:T9SS type B sorting domain-containing protein [Winogradskyella sp.]
MKNSIYLIFFIGFIQLLSAQNEASYWYFGKNGGLRFNATSGNVTAVTDGQIDTLEGCTSISDTDGNLLFYSDGRTVWNRNHQVMLNGTGLKGDESSTSSGLIVPKPQDPNFYYVFTVDEPHHFNSTAFPNQTDGDGINDGLMYSRVNINDDGGLGAVDLTEKNVPLITYDTANPLEVDYKCSEKITAVRADDCSSFWVITHFIDKFYAFKVDTNGVSTTPVVSTVGPVVPVSGYRRNALGYMKASPDGSKLAVAHFGFATVAGGDAGGGIYLFDFDNDTGVVSNSIELYGPQNNNSPYGIEFSAENKKVYATVGFGINGNGASQILQWDLEATNIPGTMLTIHSSNTLSAGALQLGIDRRIYRAQVSFGNLPGSGRYLGTINNPELAGFAAEYDEQGQLVDIGGNFQNLSRIGLPPFIQSLFNSQIDIIQNGISTTELRLCEGDTYTLRADDLPGATYIWSLDGTVLPDDTFELEIDTPGFYELFIEPNNGECPIEGNAVVGVFEIPEANTPSNEVICDDNNDGVASFNFLTKNAEVLGNQDSTVIQVSYHLSLSDAENNLNPLSVPYANTNQFEQIFVRAEHIENPNCYDVTSFNISVFNTPIVNLISDVEFCDDEDDTSDGIATVDLSSLNNDVIGSQDASEINISFHDSLTDAEQGINDLPLNYRNSTPFNETLFVRVENKANVDCFDTSDFSLIVNDAPIALDATILQCDEDDLQDGLTTFNISQVENDITSGEANRMVTYFLNIADAEDDENSIDGNAFENTTNPQSVIAKVTNTITNCSSYSTVELEVSTTSSNTAFLESCDDDGTEDGFTLFDLNEASTQILEGLTTDLDIQFFETYDEALLENNPLSLNYTNAVAYNHTIFARVENNNACYGISEVELVVYQLPNIQTTAETIYCLNSFPDIITLNGGVINDIPNNYNYNWSTGETTSSIDVDAPGTYSVTVSNTNGCSKERTIVVQPSNIAEVTDINVMDATQNNSVTIFVTGEGDYEYALDTINGPYQDENTFNNVQPGLYTIYIRDKNNCGITEDLVSVVGFPKFFTPNNDGVNDYWQVKGINRDFQPNTSILIFNRYGKLLAEIDPVGPGWDGTLNGNKLPSSDYWFSVQLEDGRIFTSHFTLKR